MVEESKNKVESRSALRRPRSRAAMPSVAASLRSRSIRSSDGNKKSEGGFKDRRSSASASPSDETSSKWTFSTRKTMGTGGGFFGDEELTRDAEERRSYVSFETDDRYARVSITLTHTAQTHGEAFSHATRILFWFFLRNSFFLSSIAKKSDK